LRNPPNTPPQYSFFAIATLNGCETKLLEVSTSKEVEGSQNYKTNTHTDDLTVTYILCYQFIELKEDFNWINWINFLGIETRLGNPRICKAH